MINEGSISKVETGETHWPWELLMWAVGRSLLPHSRQGVGHRLQCTCTRPQVGWALEGKEYGVLR